MSELVVGSIAGLAANSYEIAISSGSKLTLASSELLVDGAEIGTWVDYSGTQTFSGLTVGNGTLESYYSRIGDIVFMEGRLVFGSTSSMTGPADMSAPFAATQPVVGLWPGACVASDGSAAFYYGVPVYIGSSVFRMTRMVVSGSQIRNGDWSSTAPFAWTAGDFFTWSFSYKAVS